MSNKDQDEWTLNFPEFIRAVWENEGAYLATLEPTLHRQTLSGSHLTRKVNENQCLSAWVRINGVRVFTLFDSGSTSDTISPNFVPAANICCFELSNPVILQLGTKASWSMINHGAQVTFQFDGPDKLLSGQGYFDIANVD